MIYFSILSLISLYCLESTFAYTCEPLSYRTGVTIHCEIAATGESINCQTARVPVGTIANYDCEDHYITNDGESRGGTMRCESSGEWTPEVPFRGFSCHIDCGRRPQGENGSKWPWQAGIYNGQKYICGGTLISPFNSGFTILTAANCLLRNDNTPYNFEDITILLGLFTTDFQSSSHGQHSESFGVKNIVFSSYDPNGIALIQLKGQLSLSNNILPACFSTNEYLAKQQLEEGNDGQLVGFGEIARYSNQPVLRSTSLKVSSDRLCKNSIGSRAFCAGLNSGNVICGNDAGSGFLTSDTFGKQSIQGVLPKGNDRCHSYSYFIKLIDFSNWMKEVVPKLHLGHNKHQSQKIYYPESILDKTTPIEIAFQRETPLYRPTTSKYESTRYFLRSTTTTPTPKFQSNEENFRDYEIIGLEWHNLYRRKHNTPEVFLSQQLNREAQKEAERSAANTRYKLEGFINWFGIVGGSLNSTSLVREAVKDWYRTGSSYDPNNPSALPFTQIIWKDTKEIGIGIATQGDKQIVLVKYNRPLTIDGEQRKSFQENVLPSSNYY